MPKIFSYGSLILPDMTQDVFKTVFKPQKSVFLKGYKLILKHADSTKYPNYHNIICTKTDNENDLVPGFLIDIPDDLIERIDRWEGKNYKRDSILCYDRNLEPIECEMYTLNN